MVEPAIEPLSECRPIDITSQKPLFAALAFVLTFGAFLPYYRSILRGEATPHVFSWGIWALGTFIVFLAQLSDGAGLGAWPIGVSAVLTLGVASLAFARKSDLTIKRIDWAFLTMAAFALPLWFATNSALSAVVILTVVDLLGFGPTVRKAYDSPHDDSALFFGLGAVRNGCVVLALGNYSWTTVLFPAAVGFACLALVALLLMRRQIVVRP